MGNGVPDDFDFGQFNRWIGKIDSKMEQFEKTLGDRKTWSKEHETRLDVLEKDILDRDKIEKVITDTLENKGVTKAYILKVATGIGAIWGLIASVIGNVN